MAKIHCMQHQFPWLIKKDTHGRMEEEANQLYRRPQTTGQARDEEEDEEE